MRRVEIKGIQAPEIKLFNSARLEEKFTKAIPFPDGSHKFFTLRIWAWCYLLSAFKTNNVLASAIYFFCENVKNDPVYVGRDHKKSVIDLLMIAIQNYEQEIYKASNTNQYSNKARRREAQ